MWFLLVIIYPVAVLGLQDTILLPSDYFRERRVAFVCVVDCGKDFYWSKEFAKMLANHSIAVTSFKANPVYHQSMERCLFQTNTLVGVVMKTSCENIEEVLITASENAWFDSEHVWLLIQDNLYNGASLYNNLTDFDVNGDRGKVMETMELLNISVDADIKMAVCTGTVSYIAMWYLICLGTLLIGGLDQLSNLQIAHYADGFQLLKLYLYTFIYNILDIFNFGKVQGGKLQVIDAGTWNVSGFSADLNENKYYKRWDFGQWPMRLVSVATVPPNDFDPAILTSLVPVPGVATITRISTIILTLVAEVHNIKFVHTLADRWISDFNRNNTRVAANSLYFGDQDLTSILRIATPLTYKVGFLIPALTSLETRYYYRIPTTGPGKYENQFLRPLSIGAWGSTVGIALLCMIILIAAARLERRQSSVQYALFSVMANICQQFFEDESHRRRSSAARELTVFITGMSFVLIYNYYTSSVVSWLLNGPPPSITSLEELLDSPLELIYQDVGYTRSSLSGPGSYYYNRRHMEVEDKIRRKIKTRTMESLLKPLEEGIAMVKAGGFAYHAETYSADELISKTFTQSELCELGSLKSMEKTLLYPGVQRDSPYKEFLTWSLIGLLERGFVSCIQHRTAVHAVACEGSSPRALALGGAAPAFIMLALGYFISTAVMLAERFIHKKKMENQNLYKE